MRSIESVFYLPSSSTETEGNLYTRNYQPLHKNSEEIESSQGGVGGMIHRLGF
jgi:hypothetical protein